MWKLLVVLVVKTVYCEELFDPSFTVNDRCVNLCRANNLPPLDLENYEQIVCQRGCKFFNIIHFKDESNFNTTTRECHLSCNESYLIPREASVCLTGCNLMSGLRRNDATVDLIDSESNNIVLIGPDIEILEADLLYDPILRGQMDVGTNADYKIPETRIRTMPIENVLHEKKPDWLGCVTGSLNLATVLIFLAGIVLALLMLVWISSPDTRFCYVEEQDLEKNATLCENCDEDVAMELPPKYTAESEKI